jgi:RluA family pseudouridine synthase
LINGKAVRATYRLKSGDEVCYFLPQESEPQVNRKIAVLWRDAGIMAVEKPSNLPMHEGGRYRLNTFYELLRSEVGEQWAAVHRLDRETSGIVICAGTKDLRNQLSAEFRQRTMKKSYLALVKGVPADDDFTVDAPIGDASQTIFRQKKWVESDGLPAVTRFRVLAKGCYHSLLEAQPLTGRTHQIRVHAAWSGYPLVGDKKYHPDESVYLDYMDNGLTEKVLEAVEGERLCLHAALLSFRRPHSEGIVTVECPMPADMRAISLRLLGSDLLGVLPGK